MSLHKYSNYGCFDMHVCFVDKFMDLGSQIGEIGQNRRGLMLASAIADQPRKVTSPPFLLNSCAVIYFRGVAIHVVVSIKSRRFLKCAVPHLLAQRPT